MSTLQYYINKGYSEEQAKAMASPKQSSSKGKKWFVANAPSQPVTAHGMRRANINSSTRMDKHALANLYKTLNKAVKAGDKDLQALCHTRLDKLAFR